MREMNSASDMKSGGESAGGVVGVNSLKYMPFKSNDGAASKPSTTATTENSVSSPLMLTGLGGLLHNSKNSSTSFDTSDLLSNSSHSSSQPPPLPPLFRPTTVVYNSGASGVGGSGSGAGAGSSPHNHQTVLANTRNSGSFNTDLYNSTTGSSSNVTIMMKPLTGAGSGVGLNGVANTSLSNLNSSASSMNKTRNATATNGGSATGSSSVVSGVGPSTNGPTTKDFGLANIGLDTIRANGAVQFAQLRNPLTKEKSKDKDKDKESQPHLKGSSSLSSNVNYQQLGASNSTTNTTTNNSGQINGGGGSTSSSASSSWQQQQQQQQQQQSNKQQSNTSSALMNDLFRTSKSSMSNSNASLSLATSTTATNQQQQQPVITTTTTTTTTTTPTHAQNKTTKPTSNQPQTQSQRCYLTYATHAQPESMDSSTSDEQSHQQQQQQQQQNPVNTTTTTTMPSNAVVAVKQQRLSITSNNNNSLFNRTTIAPNFTTNISAETIDKDVCNTSNGWLVNNNQSLIAGGSNVVSNRLASGGGGSGGGGGAVVSVSGGEIVTANGPNNPGNGGGGGGGSSDNENTALYQAAASSRLANPSSSSFSRNGGMGSKEKKSSVGYRLGKRKLLFEKRRQISDYALMFAMTGVFLMIIETEFSMSKMYSKNSSYSYIIKSLITITTLVLISLILLYHALEVQLFIIDNCIEDWRIAMTWQRITQVGVEVLVCLIHPIAGNFTFIWTTKIANTNEERRAEVPIDLILSLPMFLRLYLICRSMLLHSKLFTDASSRSIGALNRINFNTRFVLKTLMTICPGTVLLVFILSLFIIASWTIRACESFHDAKHGNLLNSMWLIAVTFLAIGYGDLVPNTYCGRAICVVSGLMGVSCTATMVAVLARKLELARAEKHVHFFMMDTQLNKRLKNAAANVLRETWLIYKYTKLVQVINPSRVRAHQRKFLQAIHSLRKVKLDQRKLDDSQNQLVDLSKVANTQKELHEIVITLNINQNSLVNRLRDVEDKIVTLQNQLNMLPLQMQSIIMEQNKLILERFQRLQKQTSLSYSGGNSFDGDSSTPNTAAAASSSSAATTNANALQIPTISTNLTRN